MHPRKPEEQQLEGPSRGELEWEDARTLLAVSRAGSLNGAARSLGVHHSTVFRRLSRLEALLGTELFVREGSRYRPTAAGEALGERAARVEEELFALQRAALGSELLPSGTLRITTLETLLPWVMPALATLEARCPDLRVELDATTETRELDRRDADMALRPSETPPEAAVGKRIAKLAWATYEACASTREKRRLVAYVGALAGMQGPRLAQDALTGRLEPAPLAARTVAAMGEALAGGFGVGALPCYIGDSDPRLARVGPAVTTPRGALWLLMHPDLRDSARMRAVVDLLVPVLSPYAPLFGGAQPRSPHPRTD